ncbi:MAG: hypothetical protein PHR43_06970, partial [Dehalococcoidales bacterium]|nr:hypothetical protein [Dehalococcoidales bacterium]
GYVERRDNPDDRRSLLLYLTPKARAVGSRILEFADELDAALRKPFSPEDMDTFEKVLRTLSEARKE